MLRSLNPRREILRIKLDPRWRGNHQRHPRRPWSSPQGPIRAGTIDSRTDAFLGTFSQCGWQTALRPRGAVAGGVDALRLKVATVRDFSFRNLRGGLGLFEGREMGNLRDFPRRRTVAQPRGRKRTSSAYRLAHESVPAALVAGREAHCFFRLNARQTLANRRNSGRRRQSGTIDTG